MKKIISTLTLILTLISPRTHAQFPIAEIIKAAVKKVIVEVDLKIQRLQNKTLWLQNAQKVIENQMSKLKLSEINDWVSKQKKLYEDYFEELRKVKTALTYYHRVKDIIADQAAMVREYKEAWNTFRQDKNFSADELQFMAGVYSGMLSESLKDLDLFFLVISSFTVQMSDAERLQMIDGAAARMEIRFLDLKEFNNHNKVMSLHRSFQKGEIEYSKKIYGL